ncbi:class I glutamine amidotransferase-like protein [Dunaliella salina]|uniref:folate gamma-glutamyl hydrolase n=1 Tax=Dunaliella salina TaxID=3046 RepID=A0ABQ7H5J9_DUNSA|nr:class I glutamine amidotransferase-like protein [Dunaliella salina]|eukprot:KAF5842134.1 class I glutamine amidotransferase-like protein [Dunaliella salina]
MQPNRLPSAGQATQMLKCMMLCSWALVGAGARMPEGITGFMQQDAKEQQPINDRPIIGILSQPGDPAPKNMSYIAASYVKWVESAGARVVPIFYDMSEEQVRQRFNVINGLLIPGGGANLSPGHKFYDTANLLVELAIQANDKGDYFPVQGTCLGLETLSIIITRNYTILGHFNALDAAAPLMYTDVARESHFLKSLPKDVCRSLQDQPIAMENHGKGLSLAAVKENKRLDDFFNVISLSVDKSGNPYVSTIEAKEYPIVATQWHPEKNPFEWTASLSIPHSSEAVRMSQEVGNFFIAEARLNMHHSHNLAEEDDLLIYNWHAEYTGRRSYDGEEAAFEQAYFFPPASAASVSSRNSSKSIE